MFNFFKPYIIKFNYLLNAKGLPFTIKKILSSIFSKFKKKIGIADQISLRRIFLSQELNKKFNGTIRYGLFKNFKFIETSWWGTVDRASMLLGLYEQEILNSLKSIPKKYKVFIDLGAADGYYGVGVLVGKLFKKSYCYEISEIGRKSIKQNAILNNVSENIIIKGIAKNNFYEDLPAEDLNESVLFVDIEGGEFDLFDKNLFKKFKESIIFIELHDWTIKDGDEKLKKMINDSQDYFSITELTTSNRDLSVFSELDKMSDTDRWLICSESRKRRMTWLRFDPIL